VAVFIDKSGDLCTFRSSRMGTNDGAVSGGATFHDTITNTGLMQTAILRTLFVYNAAGACIGQSAALCIGALVWRGHRLLAKDRDGYRMGLVERWTGHAVRMGGYR
jgi:hypothetical protein